MNENEVERVMGLVYDDPIRGLAAIRGLVEENTRLQAVLRVTRRAVDAYGSPSDGGLSFEDWVALYGDADHEESQALGEYALKGSA